jgi:hypothetical protein
MVDGLHILIWNRTKKSLEIALSWVGRGLRVRDNGGNVNNVQYKSNWIVTINYILIKFYLKKKRNPEKVKESELIIHNKFDQAKIYFILHFLQTWIMLN